MRNRAQAATIPGWQPPRITVTRILIRTTARSHVEYSTEPADLAEAPAGHPSVSQPVPPAARQARSKRCASTHMS
jgi:hypothetical protein